MKILIVSATEPEIKPLLSHLRFEKRENQLLARHSLGNHQVDVLVSGIGMVATAFHLGKTLTSENYDFLLNLGIAGSFGNRYPNQNPYLGEVVNVVSDRFAELGVLEGEGFTAMSDLGLMGETELAFSSEGKGRHSSEPGEILKSKAVQNLRKVSGITVNRLDTAEEEIQKVIRRLKPDVETMEGAAFLYAASREGIPCLQLRAVSNFAGERNKENWEVEKAIENLNDVVLGSLGL